MLHERELIARVVDDEVSRQPDMWRFASQQPGAKGVECGNPHTAAVRAQKRLDARAHLRSRLIGEGDGENAVGLREPLADEVRNAVSDDACLTRSGASQDEKRTVGIENSVPLFGIET